MTEMGAHLTNFKLLDDQNINPFHWRMVFTTGMGFFAAAYDLFIIGIVTSILAPIWHLTSAQLALLNGASLASAAFGAIFFGVLANHIGRKKMYGFEVAILFISAILSAISTSFIWLLLSRVLLGFGIGGDYPSSAVVVSEYSNRKNRGFLVLLVFGMQALGLVVGPLVASCFLIMHLPDDYVWRILLALGAIPAACVFFLRRKIAETPRFVHSKNKMASIIIYPSFQKQTLFKKKWLMPLIGTAGAWFLLDIAFYGNGVSSIFIINSITPEASLLTHTLLSAFIFLCFAVPGYIFSAIYVDRIGRKRLQTIGFMIIAICYTSMGLILEIKNHLFLFLCLFGLSFFFINFGPNATTFLIPSEIFPTCIRAQAHGISAAVGKIGAFVGAFLLPSILATYQFSFTMGVVAIISLLGSAITQALPEMSGASLESTEMLVENVV